MNNILNFNYSKLLALSYSSFVVFASVPLIYYFIPHDLANESLFFFYKIQYIVGLFGVILYNAFKLEDDSCGTNYNVNIWTYFVLTIIFLFTPLVALSLLLFIKFGVTRTISKKVTFTYIYLFILSLGALTFIIINSNQNSFLYIFLILLSSLFLLNLVGFANIWIPNIQKKVFWLNISNSNLLFRLSIDVLLFLVAYLTLYLADLYLDELSKSNFIKIIAIIGISGFLVSIFETKLLSDNSKEAELNITFLKKILLSSIIAFLFNSIFLSIYLNIETFLIICASFISMLNVISGGFITIFRRVIEPRYQIYYSIILGVLFFLVIILINFILSWNIQNMILLMLSFPLISICYLLYTFLKYKKIIWRIF